MAEGRFAILQKCVWYDAAPYRIEICSTKEVLPFVCSEVEVVKSELFRLSLEL